MKFAELVVSRNYLNLSETMHEIAFARTLARMYKFIPGPESVSRLKHKLAWISQLT
jgi:hypothetical protein